MPTLAETLPPLISELNGAINNQETSVIGELVDIEPTRGSSLYRAMQAVETCLPRPLPDVWDDWRELLILTDHDRPAPYSKRQRLQYFRLLKNLLRWAEVQNSAIPVRDKSLEARDKWIYERCCKGIALDAIVRALAKKPKWGQIETIQGIRYAARTYAKRHNLPPIPRRQDL